LQETGCKPDALTLGWYQHALLIAGESYIYVCVYGII